MRILLIHHRLPWPLDNGMDKLRYNLIKTLSTKFDITLVVPVKHDSSNNDIIQIEKYVNRLITVPVSDLRDESVLFFIKRIIKMFLRLRPYYISDVYSATFHKKLKSIVKAENFDIIHALSDFSGIYIMGHHSKSKIILGPMDDNVQTYFEFFRNSKGIKNKIISYLNYHLIKRYFNTIIVKSGIVLFHSVDDMRRAVSRVKKAVNSAILPVATEISEELSLENNSEPDSIVFVGGMGSSFNQEAVVFFIRSIFPLIRDKVPNIKFYIVGNNPPEEILRLHDDKHILVTGAVDDVNVYIKKAKVYVSPIKGGTGIKTKMVEALKAGKAIVATNKALQGLWEIDNIAIRIEDDPIKFAHAVIQILQDENLRTEMENAALKLYQNHYEYSKVVPVTLRIYSDIL